MDMLWQYGLDSSGSESEGEAPGPPSPPLDHTNPTSGYPEEEEVYEDPYVAWLGGKRPAPQESAQSPPGSASEMATPSSRPYRAKRCCLEQDTNEPVTRSIRPDNTDSGDPSLVKVELGHKRFKHLNVPTSGPYRPSRHHTLTLTGHSGAVVKVAWAPTNGFLLGSASLDGTMRVWDVFRSQETLCTVRHDGGVKSIAWSEEGGQILSGGFDKVTRLTDIEKRCEIQTFSQDDFVTAVCWQPGHPNNFLTGGFRSGVVSWDTRVGKVVWRHRGLVGTVQSLLFLPDTTSCVVAADAPMRNASTRAVMVLDMKGGAVLSDQIFRELYTCTSLALHPAGNHFIAQTNGNYMARFDTQRPYRLDKRKRYEGHEVMGYPMGCDISPDGSMVVTGSATGRLHYYDYATSRSRHTVQVFNAPCVDVACHPTLPTTSAVASWEGRLAVWT